MDKDPLLVLLRSKATVFTIKDLALIWNETDADLVKKRAFRYVKAGKLYPIRRGIYGRDENYDKLELANKIFTPSYISFETILGTEGVIFQRYDQIFVASYLARAISCDGRTYVFRRMKKAVLLNASGIEPREGYHVASKERACLDTIYLNKSYHFDNLASINWDKCFDLVPIYQNKAMVQRLQSYYKLASHA